MFTDEGWITPRPGKRPGFEIRFWQFPPGQTPFFIDRFVPARRPAAHYACGLFRLPADLTVRSFDGLDEPGSPLWEIRERITLCDTLNVRPSTWARHRQVTCFLSRNAALAEHHAIDHTREYADADGRLLLVSEPYCDGRACGDEAHANCVLAIFRRELPGWQIVPMPAGYGSWLPPRTRLFLIAPPDGFQPCKGARKVSGYPLTPDVVARLMSKMCRATKQRSN